MTRSRPASAGVFLGEALFRMASLVLEGGSGKPGFWRELGAAVISPPTGFNRLVFGNRFDAVFPSHDPAISTRLRLGASLTAHVTDQGVSSTVKRTEATADFSMAYGLPGKPGYSYKRPFDYFHFEFTAVPAANVFENIMTRGLLFGTKYAAGRRLSRDVGPLRELRLHIAADLPRLEHGPLARHHRPVVALARGGAPGHGPRRHRLRRGRHHRTGTGERDYHYGATPQGLLALRLILGDRAMLDLTGQEYYVSGVGSTENRGSENIARGTASFTVRVYGRHAIGIKYVASHRDAHYPDIPDRHQTIGTVSVAYTFLGDTKFGAVEWRAADADGR